VIRQRISAARLPENQAAHESHESPKWGKFEETGALTPQQQQDIPRVIEIGKKFGLEFPPPPGG
jgi:hypothetical protein